MKKAIETVEAIFSLVTADNRKDIKLIRISYKRYSAIKKLYNSMEVLNDDYLTSLADKAAELKAEQQSIINYAFENKDKILKELKGAKQ